MLVMAECEDFLPLIIGAGEVAAKVAKNLIADMDALDRWADDGGPCIDSV
jgi:hypothetical protein